MQAAMEIHVHNVRRIHTLAQHTKMYLFFKTVWELFYRKYVARKLYFRLLTMATIARFKFRRTIRCNGATPTIRM